MMNHYTTNTTPTLTPTTLRIIEEFGITPTDQSESTGSFVPPLPSSSQVHLNTWNGGRILNTNDNSNEEELESVSELKPEVNTTVAKKRGGRRAAGGRKPAAHSNLSPEENERRTLRRERNKQAAARCRKRRVDHTNALQEETDHLEDIKKSLQTQITKLQHEKEELEFILDAHGPCKKPNNTTTTTTNNVVHRPTSLDLKTPSTPSAGLDIDWNLTTGFTPTGFTPLMTPGTTGALISGLGLIKEEVCDGVGNGELRML